MKFIDIITNPGEALLKAKQEKSMGHSLLVAFAASVLITISAVLLIMPFMQLGTTTAGMIGGASASAATGFFAGMGLAVVAIVVFILVLVFEFLMGLLSGVVMKTLGGKGGFFEGLTVIAYSCFVSSVALAALGVLSFIPLIGPVIGGIIALLLFGISLAILYRGLKELFETDMVTAFVGTSIIATATIFTIYAVMAYLYIQLIAMLGSLAVVRPGLGMGAFT